MSLPQHEQVRCECGGNQFVELKRLRIHPSQGPSTEPAGYFCPSCNVIADVDFFKRKLELERARTELKAKEQELEEINKEKDSDAKPSSQIPRDQKGQGSPAGVR